MFAVAIPGGAEPTWGTHILIETDNAGDARAPQVVVDRDGNVTAAWKEYDGTRWDIYASRYPANGSWSTPALVSDGAGSTSSLAAVVDQVGEVTAVWVQSDGTRTSIWSNRFE